MDNRKKLLLERIRACEEVFESAPAKCAADAAESSSHSSNAKVDDVVVENSLTRRLKGAAVLRRGSTENSNSQTPAALKNKASVDVADWWQIATEHKQSVVGVFENAPAVSSADIKICETEDTVEDHGEKSLFVQKLSEVGVLRRPPLRRRCVTVDSGSHSSPSNGRPRHSSEGHALKRPLQEQTNLGGSSPHSATERHINGFSGLGQCTQDCSEIGVEGTSPSQVRHSKSGSIKDIAALQQVMQECSETDVGVCQNQPSMSKADFQSGQYLEECSKNDAGVCQNNPSMSKADFQCPNLRQFQKLRRQLSPEALDQAGGGSNVHMEKECDETTQLSNDSDRGANEADSPEDENDSTFLQEDLESEVSDCDNLSQSSFRSADGATAYDAAQPQKDTEGAVEAPSAFAAAEDEHAQSATEHSKAQSAIFVIEATPASFNSGFYLAVLDALESWLESMPPAYTDFMLVMFGDHVKLCSFNTNSGRPRVMHLSCEDFFLPEPLSCFVVDPVPWKGHLQDLLTCLRSLQPHSDGASPEEGEGHIHAHTANANSWNAVLSLAVDAAAFAGGGHVVTFNASLPNHEQYRDLSLPSRMLSRRRALQERFQKHIAKECCSRNIAITPICLMTHPVAAGLDLDSLRWLSSSTSSELKTMDFTSKALEGNSDALAEQVRKTLSCG